MIERQKRNTMALAAISLLILLVLDASSAKGDNNSCSMAHRLHGEMVNIKKAKENAEKNNGIVSVPKALTVNSSEDCEQGCCGNTNCTVYLFYPRPASNDEHKNYNCFFLNCRPQNLCSLVNVSNKAEGAVVGFRSLQPSGNIVEPKVTANLASVSTSTVKPKADAGHKKSSTPKLNSTTSTEKSTNASKTAQSKALTTFVPVEVGKTTGKYDTNHTTYASLVIALGFGILFFFAVIVLIGRPWWYSYHRPRYSKVDYLMNGL